VIVSCRSPTPGDGGRRISAPPTVRMELTNWLAHPPHTIPFTTRL
jgi:hypothetical protein